MTSKVRDGLVKRGGSWSYVVRVTHQETGVSRPKWVGGFPTEAAARAARDDARVAARRGEYVDKSSTTVADYLREWLQTYQVAVKPTTFEGYRHNVEHYVIPRIGNLRLQAVRPAIISKLYRDLLDHGGRREGPLSPLTVDGIHRTLRKAFNDAVRVEQLLPSNPVVRATRPKARGKERADLWTTEQLRTFLAVAAGHRIGAFYRLAAYTGARRGELTHMRWSDLDLDAAELTISGSAATIGAVRVEGTTKGGRSRVVSLDAGTVEVMRAHRKAQLAEQLAARTWWQDGDNLVFLREDGAPMHTDTPTALMPKLIAQAGLPHTRLHDLRHLHATTLLLAGVPVHVVAARLGHADPAITLRVYAHVLREQASGIADVFAAVVDG